ncbi:MAG: HD domain-containing protein [Anaerolineae bacterium]
MTSGPDLLLDLLLASNRLKALKRQGWSQRGVLMPESIAEHSHQVALVARLLLDRCDAALDREKVLTIAILHDLAEALLTDIPEPALRHLGREAKRQAEESALRELLAGLPRAEEYVAWWREFEEDSTPEGRLVRDADRLELIVQAYAYEQAGHRGLDEFWEAMAANTWYYPESETLFVRLSARRASLGLSPMP